MRALRLALALKWRSSAAAVVSYIVGRAVVCAMTDTVGIAQLVVWAIIGTVADTVGIANIVIGPIIGIMADAMPAAIGAVARAAVAAAILGTICRARASVRCSPISRSAKYCEMFSRLRPSFIHRLSPQARLEVDRAGELHQPRVALG